MRRSRARARLFGGRTFARLPERLARWLRARSRVSHRDRTLELLGVLVETTGASYAVWLRAACTPAGVAVADAVSSPPEVAASFAGRSLGRDLLRPEARWTAGFVDARDVLGPDLLADRPGAVLSVIAGEQRVFGVVLLGAPRRSLRSSPEVERILAKLRSRLRAWVLEEEALPAGKILLGAGGDILFTCSRGQGWLDRLDPSPSLVQGTILHRGASISSERLDGAAANAWLLEIRAPAPVMIAPDAGLTRMQRRVADYAAAGATIPEIARSLESSPETVRTHLREVYRRLGVSCRIELVRALAPAA